LSKLSGIFSPDVLENSFILNLDILVLLFSHFIEFALESVDELFGSQQVVLEVFDDEFFVVVFSLVLDNILICRGKALEGLSYVPSCSVKDATSTLYFAISASISFLRTRLP
jgi:hypothetical protein